MIFDASLEQPIAELPHSHEMHRNLGLHHGAQKARALAGPMRREPIEETAFGKADVMLRMMERPLEVQEIDHHLPPSLDDERAPLLHRVSFNACSRMSRVSVICRALTASPTPA